MECGVAIRKRGTKGEMSNLCTRANYSCVAALSAQSVISRERWRDKRVQVVFNDDDADKQLSLCSTSSLGLLLDISIKGTQNGVRVQGKQPC